MRNLPWKLADSIRPLHIGLSFCHPHVSTRSKCELISSRINAYHYFTILYLGGILVKWGKPRAAFKTSQLTISRLMITYPQCVFLLYTPTYFSFFLWLKRFSTYTCDNTIRCLSTEFFVCRLLQSIFLRFITQMSRSIAYSHLGSLHGIGENRQSRAELYETQAHQVWWLSEGQIPEIPYQRRDEKNRWPDRLETRYRIMRKHTMLRHHEGLVVELAVIRLTGAITPPFI